MFHADGQGAACPPFRAAPQRRDAGAGRTSFRRQPDEPQVEAKHDRPASERQAVIVTVR